MEAAGTEAGTGTEEPRKTNKKAKKAKVKKDKWGQPLLVPVDDAEQASEDEQFQRNVGEKAVVPEEGTESHELTKVVVSGMPYSATEKQIRDLFKDIGPVSQLQLSRFPDTGNFRGLAFVTFQVPTLFLLWWIILGYCSIVAFLHILERFCFNLMEKNSVRDILSAKSLGQLRTNSRK